ncbi:MAG: hypothetical protein KDJ73_03125 [Notoacmeibacter sp.]|nr:hypothetical protein [Notoacmeibacter sp.]MCC0033307.1 hypothetical protein [Brucellaceae bacterium]
MWRTGAVMVQTAMLVLSATATAGAASGRVEFSGTVPARGQTALFPVQANLVSFANASGIDLTSANAGAAKVVRVFSVDGGDGSKIEASVFPARAVIAPGGAAQIRVIVPFGTRSTHAYRVCAESRSPSGAFLGRQCGHYQARRVSLD